MVALAKVKERQDQYQKGRGSHVAMQRLMAGKLPRGQHDWFSCCENRWKVEKAVEVKCSSNGEALQEMKTNTMKQYYVEYV